MGRKSQSSQNNTYPEVLHDHLDGVANDLALWFSLLGTGDQRHVEAKDAFSGRAYSVVNQSVCISETGLGWMGLTKEEKIQVGSSIPEKPYLC